MHSKQESFKKLSTVSRATTTYNLGVRFFKKTGTKNIPLPYAQFFNKLPAALECIKKFNEYENKIKNFIITNQENQNSNFKLFD
nr:unnamed protein product [Callosobruchus analis]